MSNLTDFLGGGGGGGGLTPKFQEFNSSGTFTPSQALIDAGGYIEIFIVGGGGASNDTNVGGVGGEVLIKSMYLTSTTNVTVSIGAGGSTFSGENGSASHFYGATAGGSNVTASGGYGSDGGAIQYSIIGAPWPGQTLPNSTAGSGVLGFGAGGASQSNARNGVYLKKANSGQGGYYNNGGGSGYCLVKWYE